MGLLATEGQGDVRSRLREGFRDLSYVELGAFGLKSQVARFHSEAETCVESLKANLGIGPHQVMGKPQHPKCGRYEW